jgi:hypothetical protein
MRYRLRTLLIVLAVAPPLIAIVWRAPRIILRYGVIPVSALYVVFMVTVLVILHWRRVNRT